MHQAITAEFDPRQLRGESSSPRLTLDELVIPTNRKARRAEASLKRRRHR
jgi:hypothetical protein